MCHICTHRQNHRLVAVNTLASRRACFTSSACFSLSAQVMSWDEHGSLQQLPRFKGGPHKIHGCLGPSIGVDDGMTSNGTRSCSLQKENSSNCMSGVRQARQGSMIPFALSGNYRTVRDSRLGIFLQATSGC